MSLSSVPHHKRDNEQDNENKEVQRILSQGKEAKRKLITGTVYFKFVKLAVRKVAASHKMVGEGHKNIAAGWDIVVSGIGTAFSKPRTYTEQA